ncbi:MAG: transporter, partial [Frankiales bacterium]|nr:transporter [Frankiales bacterium]
MTGWPTRTAERPTSPAAKPAGRWIALAVMCSTILLISLDQTVLNVALPTLVDDLHPSSVGLQWIVDSYTLTNAVLLLFGGALGDRIGRRRVYLIGLLIFGSGSLACALIHSVGPLIGFRAFMGFGASLLMPATLAIIASEFEGKERARAIGIWAGVGGIGTAGGPLIGGWLLEHFWWGSIFLINVPIAVVALIGTLLVVKESRADVPRRLDPIGVLLSAAGLTAITYAVISAPRDGWQSATVVWVLSAGVALLAVFGVWDHRQQDPLLDLRLFANRTFSSALGAVTAVFFAMFGVSYLLSQYIQFVQGIGVFGVGLRFIPLAAGTLVASNLSARLTG